MLKKSSQVALGGVVASLCILLMLMTGFFPFLTYAAPAAAGFLLIAVQKLHGEQYMPPAGIEPGLVPCVRCQLICCNAMRYS